MYSYVNRVLLMEGLVCGGVRTVGEGEGVGEGGDWG